MTTLVLASTRVDTLHSGYDLRVAQLCALVPDELHLVIAPHYPLPARVPTIDTSTLFASVTECPPILTEPSALRRHFRLDNHHYLRMSRPREAAAIRRLLSAVMAERGVDRIIVFGESLSELVVDLPSCTRILDVCDSTALTQRRAFEHAGGLRGGNWIDALDLCRARRTEARLPALFDAVTTVGAVDTAEIVELSGAADDVITVPNGVDEAFLAPMPPPATRRGVVFWGNLDFEPNSAALTHFFDEIWFPALRAAGVEVTVIGRAAPVWLKDVAEREPLVRVLGFVSDLRTEASRYPVMINPMQTGSGLKNKVLEAFGLGIAVVSTLRGVEAFPAVRHDEHLVVATGGAEFVAAVLRLLDDPDLRLRLRANANALLHEHYPWPVSGLRWRELFTATDVDVKVAAGQGRSG
ncbi:glycosyltransferase [Mycolicibacterium fluoranthenivorans]|uniref:Glycosyltransferase involved in cell wall bisynthesis n=1 Tax=Mycolicibacterium fluoranthenivorans TaxID=258505 RepID=A0A1G4VIA4_9MYCO|nr:glycosyltransferase [Mycolicibacterium fluoranthenivorans]SCX07186.1 Glycosyltransferase involved in cell wall bisynthesis [Mycolicibacterium fluoranthenivorans]